MAGWTPDPSFYPSPRMAMKAAPETIAYVAAFDPEAEAGSDIPIEERDPDEVRHVLDTHVSPEDVPVFNPAFDITPARFVTAFITEKGVLYPPFDSAIASLF